MRRAAVTIYLFVLVSATGAVAARESGFAGSMASAMQRMHEAMRIAPTGDADNDFAAAMIAHHQGAVEMAMLELRFGKDDRLRRLAQAIIVTQGQEIEVMQRILADRRLESSPADRKETK